MNDRFERFQTRRFANEVGGKVFLPDLDEVCCIRRVISADNEKKIHGLGKHVEEGVLTLLGCSADRIKNLEVVR